MALDFTFMDKYWEMFLQGAWITLQLSFFGVLLGTLLGIGLALMKISKNVVLKAVSSTYIELIRGTPMLVQVFIIYFGLVPLGLELSKFEAGVAALTINSAAYMAEVFRAGINAIDKGQAEAARSLGMTHGMTLRHIILPQAFRNMLPAIGNEFIIIIKDSSLVSTIGAAEIMYAARTVQGAAFKPLEPLLVAAAMYFVITFTLSKLLGVLERRLQKK
ncbi:amino acid ABC transporter permease [Paenibacillus sp. SYP-B4298]|uniref:amino acid ABC transporter permease n=1 Tax=Paenibacillus sp. SYP-B4298 TaxID=2996034 RepID=UPI0022DD62E5|nr:amino acid ABC transporter permease [Paenibacillus sp. SYP-B4298]